MIGHHAGSDDTSASLLIGAPVPRDASSSNGEPARFASPDQAVDSLVTARRAIRRACADPRRRAILFSGDASPKA
jgi:hypothetical protein